MYYVLHPKKYNTFPIDLNTISKLCKYVTNYTKIEIIERFDTLPRYAYIGLPFYVQNTIWEFLLVMNRTRVIPKVIVPFICDLIAYDYMVKEPVNLATGKYLFLSLIKKYIKGEHEEVEIYSNLMYPAFI